MSEISPPIRGILQDVVKKFVQTGAGASDDPKPVPKMSWISILTETATPQPAAQTGGGEPFVKYSAVAAARH